MSEARCRTLYTHDDRMILADHNVLQNFKRRVVKLLPFEILVLGQEALLLELFHNLFGCWSSIDIVGSEDDVVAWAKTDYEAWRFPEYVIQGQGRISLGER